MAGPAMFRIGRFARRQ